jgi:hypothetical protein
MGPAQTTLSANVPPGSTVLPVNGQQGFEIGDIVEIDPDFPCVEIGQIVGFGSILLKTPLKFEHLIGAKVIKMPDGLQIVEPVPTTSSVIPSYSYVGSRPTTSYMAQPTYASPTTSYMAPQTTSYAAPAYSGYAAPATYAAPASYSNYGVQPTYAAPTTSYASPMTTSYAAGGSVV